MPTYLTSNLKKLVLIERLRQARVWLFGLGIASTCFSISMIGTNGINPKWWGNTFSAMRDMGLLHWIVLPSFGVGVVFLVAAAVIAVFLRKMERRVS